MFAPKSSRGKLGSPSEKRLAVYGVAAGAALAAGVAPAQANLVTLDLTGLNSTDRSTGAIGDLWFDVNAATASAAVSTTGNFAGADFHIVAGNNGPPSFHGFASISGVNPNGIAGVTLEGFKASNLASSHFVGPTDNFNSRAVITSKFTGLDPGETGFLGLKFTIGSDIHYGWANVTVGTADYANITLNSLGYETNPDTPAHVEGSGVPDQGSTLALLAIGAAGLAAFRARQNKTV